MVFCFLFFFKKDPKRFQIRARNLGSSAWGLIPHPQMPPPITATAQARGPCPWTQLTQVSRSAGVQDLRT